MIGASGLVERTVSCFAAGREQPLEHFAAPDEDYTSGRAVALLQDHGVISDPRSYFFRLYVIVKAGSFPSSTDML